LGVGGRKREMVGITIRGKRVGSWGKKKRNGWNNNKRKEGWELGEEKEKAKESKRESRLH
jgi:hypothetical protein